MLNPELKALELNLPITLTISPLSNVYPSKLVSNTISMTEIDVCIILITLLWGIKTPFI